MPLPWKHAPIWWAGGARLKKRRRPCAFPFPAPPCRWERCGFSANTSAPSATSKQTWPNSWRAKSRPIWSAPCSSSRKHPARTRTASGSSAQDARISTVGGIATAAGLVARRMDRAGRIVGGRVLRLADARRFVAADDAGRRLRRGPGSSTGCDRIARRTARSETPLDIDELLQRANRILWESSAGNWWAGLWLGQLNLADGRCHFGAAGRPTGLWLKPDWLGIAGQTMRTRRT